MKAGIVRIAGVCMLLASVASVQATVVIETVAVGNPGNLPDTRREGERYGAVARPYEIGKYEITAGQYCAFLNKVAAWDTYELYSESMDQSVYFHGCNIIRHGLPGDHTYSVAPEYANRPVNFVSWGDAVRFCNWLHNGQRAGAQDATTTEDGAYDVHGVMTGEELMLVSRRAHARYFLPTEDQWYKAAYYNAGATPAGYWTYPTQSDVAPINTLPDPGNHACFFDQDYTPGEPHWRTEVGAFVNSPSPYGTFDQGGNLWEWNETVQGELIRGCRGGSYANVSLGLSALADNANNFWAEFGSPQIGFRVAVPEPGAWLLLMTGGIAWRLIAGRRKNT